MGIYITKSNSPALWSRAGRKGESMEKEKTYEELILTHLQRYKQLTDVEARERFGTNRASEYIRRLREKGHMIDTEWVTSKNRYGKKIKHGVYVYVK